MHNFYIYLHLRKDNCKIFYVGKGCHKRAKVKGSRRNKYWHNIVNKHGYIIKIFKSNLLEQNAFKLEKTIIKYLKQKGYNLANMTNGGKGGISGYKHLDSTKKKLSKIKKKNYIKENHPRFGLYGKNNPLFGFKHKEKSKLKMSINSCMKRPEVVAKIKREKHPKAQPVMYNNKLFKCILDLSDYLKINTNTIRTRLHRNPQKWGYVKEKMLDKQTQLK